MRNEEIIKDNTVTSRGVGARDPLRGVEAKSGRMEWDVPKVGVLGGRDGGSITQVRSKGDTNVFIQKLQIYYIPKYIHTYYTHTHSLTHVLSEKCPAKDHL